MFLRIVSLLPYVYMYVYICKFLRIVSINAVEEDFASKNDEGEEEVPIGTEIPRQEHSDIDEIHCREGDHNTQHALNYNDHGVHIPVILSAL